MIKPIKSLGQNFLYDETILKKIANSINTNENDLIVEIGPGKGALTKYLKDKKSYLICFEIDERMKEYLSKYEDKKTKIIFKDFLNVDILKDCSCFNYQNIYIIANIPYYITTPIIKKIIDIPEIKSISLLVQKEVANRLTASIGSKDNGSLTIYLNYFFDIKYLFTVKNTCFKPIPKVDSAVVNFIRKKEKPKVNNEQLFFKLINDSFKLKRKTLKNNLKNYDFLIVKNVLSKYNLNESVRAEELSLDVFIDIANNLNKFVDKDD